MKKTSQMEHFPYDLLARGLANLLSKGVWILIADFPSFLTWFPKVSKHPCVDFKHCVVEAFTKLSFIPHVFPHCPVHRATAWKKISAVESRLRTAHPCLTSRPLAPILRDEFSSLVTGRQWSTSDETDSSYWSWSAVSSIETRNITTLRPYSLAVLVRELFWAFIPLNS